MTVQTKQMDTIPKAAPTEESQPDFFYLLKSRNVQGPGLAVHISEAKVKWNP